MNTGIRTALRRVSAGDFGCADVCSTGAEELSVTGAERVLIVVILSGTVQIDGGHRYRPGDVVLASHPEAGYRCRTQDLRSRVYALSMPLLSTVNHGRPRFLSARPANARARVRWACAARYVDRVLGYGEAAPPPVVDEAARLLAATTLAVFPHRTLTGAGPRHTAALPTTLRDATAFIDDHVTENVRMSDIAEAVHLTPRSVQALFRRHLDTTPMQYLTQARLERAHRELLGGDPAVTTVAQIAARCGFTHHGRFAVRYREVFGRSPSATLHADGPC